HIYGHVRRSLTDAGARVVASDVGFPEHRGLDDTPLAAAFATGAVPVVLAYGGTSELAGGKVGQTGVDQMPLKAFRCADANPDAQVACGRPLPNVVLASTDLVLDRDGVVRRIPLAVQPACFAAASCSTPLIDTFGFAAYRAYQLGADFLSGPDLAVAGGTARFGQAWSTPVDSSGSVLGNY